MRTAKLLAIALALLALPAGAAGAGEKMYREFAKKGQIYADERWQRYVRDIGVRLLRHTNDAKRKYHFHVLDGDEVNAFATGDAYIFVSRGLLAYLESEDQLAAVIGHEIGHVVGRHMRKRRLTNISGKLVGIAAAVATGRGELSDLANKGTTVLVSGYGREMELEADQLGGEFMARAGYNPEAIIDAVWVLWDQQLFSKQVGAKSSGYHSIRGIYASHPRNDLRKHKAVEYARGMAPEETAEPLGDFWTLMDGLVYGDEASEGSVRDETYYHGGLRVVMPFPQGWSVTAPQTQVVAVAPGGKAEAAITVTRHEVVKRRTPEEYVSKVLQRDDVENGRELEVNGAPAFIGEIDTSESNAQLQLIAVLYLRQDVFLLKGECGPQGDLERFRAQFEETLNALRPMTSDDVQELNSRRIEVVVAEPGATYADLATRTSLRSHPVEMLRLLNADYPNGEPRAGDYVKLVK